MKIAVRQPVLELGLTQASSVIAFVRSSEAESGTSTRLLVPLKLSAPPYLPPVVRVAPTVVPLFWDEEESVTVVPAASSKP